MTETRQQRFRDYSAFWRHYLREHAKPETRALHLGGTALAIIALLALILTGDPWFVPLALIAGYGPAWFAHFFVEKNRPATFSHPWWSLISDFRMAGLWVIGRLDRELISAGVTAPPPR
jgi:hypothetical protein